MSSGNGKRNDDYDAEDQEDLDAEDAEDNDEADERTDGEAAEDGEKALDESGAFEDHVVISAPDLAEILGVDAGAVRDVCASLDVDRLGTSYAIDRDTAADVIQELAALGVI